MSVFLAYMNSFVRTEKILFDYLTTKKDSRVWIGPVEAILALAYIRFRSGAKFRLRKGFKIANDHSHPVRFWDYQFNVQGLKRRMMGGNSMDLLNFKTPLFFSKEILDQLRPENKEILLKLGIESIHSLIDTYKKDIAACESLRSMGVILECMIKDRDMNDIKPFLYVNDDFLESPLTKKDQEIWIENIDILNRICSLFRTAYENYKDGKNSEDELTEVNELRDQVRQKLEDFLMEIPAGRS